MVDDDVAAGLEPHFGAQRFVQLLLDAEFLKDGRFLGVQLHARDELRLEAAHEFDDLREFLFVVQPDGGVILAQIIAQDALNEVQVAVEQGRRAALLGGGANRVPGAAEKLDVGANFVVARFRSGGADDEAAGKSSLGFGDEAAQARAVFRRADAPRNADVVDRGHVHEEAAGQRDVARDARSFFTKWFFCNLNNNFLAGLQHFGNQLRAAVLFVPRMPVLRRTVRTPAGAPSALRTISAAHGTLKTRARLFGNARARGRLPFAHMRRLSGSVESFVSFCVIVSVSPGVFFSRQLRVPFAVIRFVPFHVLFRVAFHAISFVPFRAGKPWRRLRRQRYVMHFVGESVGLFRRIFVIVFLITFPDHFPDQCPDRCPALPANPQVRPAPHTIRPRLQQPRERFSASACASSCLASISCWPSEVTSSSESSVMCASVMHRRSGLSIQSCRGREQFLS